MLPREHLKILRVLSWRCLCQHKVVIYMKSVPSEAQKVVVATIRKVASNPLVPVPAWVVHEYRFSLIVGYDSIKLLVAVHVPVTFQVSLRLTSTHDSHGTNIATVIAENSLILRHLALVEGKGLDHVLVGGFSVTTVELSKRTVYTYTAFMIYLLLGVTPNDIIYGLSIDIEIANHAIAFRYYVAISAYIPIEKLTEPMVTFRVGSHAYLSRPFRHTTISGIDSAEAIPSKSRALVKIDEVVLPPLESLQHLALGLVCYMGNVYTRARRKIHVRVAALHHIHIAAVHLLELIENTSTRFQVAKVVT